MKRFSLSLAPILVLPFLSMVPLGVHAQSQFEGVDPVREFHQEYGPHWEIQLHPDFGTPTLIQATTPLGIFAEDGYSVPVGGPTLEEKAQLFLRKHEVLFGLTGAERGLSHNLVHSNTQRGESQSVVRFNQQVGVVPVVGHGYQFFFNADDEITLVLGLFDPNLEIDTNPSISATIARSLAAQRASELVHQVVPPQQITTEFHQTVIVNPPSFPYLAQVVSVSDKASFLDALMHIDAKTGEVRVEQSRALPVTGGDGLDFPAPSPPFVVNLPLQHSQLDSGEPTQLEPGLDVTYGLVYLTIPADGSPVARELDQLTSSTYLIGNAVDSMPTNGTRVSAGPDFFYGASSVGLDEVNVYYHMTSMNEYMENIFNSNYIQKPSRTYGYAYNNAQYHPGFQQWIFGSSSLDAGITSRDDDVIRHEFVHFALFEEGLENAHPNGNPLGVHAELHEAFADYFAATYDGDPRMLRWLAKCSTTGDNRRLDNNPAIYSDNNSLDNVIYSYCGSGSNQYLQTQGNGPHHKSMVWSGALWDLRGAIGETEATNAVVSTIQFANGSSFNNFDAAAGALINTVNLANRCAVKNVFYERGMSSACDPYAEPDPSYTANISGPTFLFNKQNYTWTVGDNSGTSGATFTWYYQTLGTSTWSVVGTGSSYTHFAYHGHPHFRLRADAVYGQSSATAYHTAYVYNTGGEFRPGEPPAEPGAEAMRLTAPAEFSLDPAYPNPAVDAITFGFTIPSEAVVRIALYDLVGRHVTDLENRSYPTGSHAVEVELSALPAGVYVYRLTAGPETTVRQLTIAR